jgi:hypothetical protein
MMVRIEAEILLPDGTILHPGDVVRTEEFPGLEVALAAKAASSKDDPPVRRIRTK